MTLQFGRRELPKMVETTTVVISSQLPWDRDSGGLYCIYRPPFVPSHPVAPGTAAPRRTSPGTSSATGTIIMLPSLEKGSL